VSRLSLRPCREGREDGTRMAYSSAQLPVAAGEAQSFGLRLLLSIGRVFI
jgi:hypothetical protein